MLSGTRSRLILNARGTDEEIDESEIESEESDETWVDENDAFSGSDTRKRKVYPIQSGYAL